MGVLFYSVMRGSTNFINVFKETASLLYAKNTLTLHDIYDLVPFERHGMIEIFNQYTEELNEE